uniref:Uncharacterized protein n=1 Tax=Caenorhabditis tropicalis TaxID=1561998 RepID=A0A1I7TQV2_9PELO
MADGGYEEVGPGPGTPVQNDKKGTIPAFPVASGPAPNQNAAEIPQFPPASSTSGTSNRPSQVDTTASTIGGSTMTRSTHDVSSDYKKPSGVKDMEKQKKKDEEIVYQRPNSLDVCQLSIGIFLTFIAIIVFNIIYLGLNGTIQVDFVNGLREL